MRTTYVMRDGALVEKAYAAPLSGSAYVISDTMDPTRNMADGQLYDSKRAFAKAVRAAGCEIVGNDPAGKRPRDTFAPSITGHDVKAALEQLRSRS